MRRVEKSAGRSARGRKLGVVSVRTGILLALAAVAFRGLLTDLLHSLFTERELPPMIRDNPSAVLILVAALTLISVFAARRYLTNANLFRDHAAEQAARESEFDEFFTYYYRSPAPTKAPRMFEYYLENWFNKDPRGRPLFEFLFARIAKGSPEVLRGYEALLPQATHEARLTILAALALAGDEQTRKFLEARINNSQFGAEKNVIGKILEAPIPVPADIFQRPVRCPLDLDFLWTEFSVTGNPRAVSRLIDVLEWPDRLREKLCAWMQSTCAQPQQVQLLEQVGIVLDYAEREVVNAEDLDILSMADTSTSLSRERFQEVKSALPFPLSEEDTNYIGVKASAKWSLTSNAERHPLILQTCEAEAAKRTGRAKLALLEIVSRTYLAQGDFVAGCNHFDSYRRLKYDLQNPQLSAAKAELRGLRGLSPSSASLEPGELPDPGRIARLCAEETEKASSYLTERLIIDRAEEYLKPKEYISMEWQAQFVKPDRFHVTQIAREPDGSEPYDEWITIGQEHYDYIGYWFRLEERSTRVGLNHTMGPEQCLGILRSEQPCSALLHHYRDQRYTLLQYEIRDEQHFPGLGDEVEFPIHVRFWIEANSELLAKVEMVIQPRDDPARKGVPGELVHTFAGYGLKLRIEPPEPWMVQSSNTR